MCLTVTPLVFPAVASLLRPLWQFTDWLTDSDLATVLLHYEV